MLQILDSQGDLVITTVAPAKRFLEMPPIWLFLFTANFTYTYIKKVPLK